MTSISNLRHGIVPPNTTIASLANLYTNALMTAFQNSSTCYQVVNLTQSSIIDCTSPEIAAQSVVAATSPECKYALVNSLPNPELYCSVCSASDINQQIVATFTATCDISSPAIAAANYVASWLNTPGNMVSPVARPTVKTDITNPNYVKIVNMVISGLNSDFATQIYQGLIAGQNVTVTNGQTRASGITQNAIYNQVLNACLQNQMLTNAAGQLDGILSSNNTSTSDGYTTTPTTTPTTNSTPVNSGLSKETIKMIEMTSIFVLIILIVMLGFKYSNKLGITKSNT